MRVRAVSLELDVVARGAGRETTSVTAKAAATTTTTSATTKAATATTVTAITSKAATTTTTATATAKAATATTEASTTALVTSRSCTTEISAKAAAKEFESVHFVDSSLSSVFTVKLDITVTLKVSSLAVGRQSDADNVTETFESFTKSIVVALEADVANKDSVRFLAKGLGALVTAITGLAATSGSIINTKLTAHELGFMVFLGLGLGFAISKVDIAITVIKKKKVCEKIFSFS
jgi:hypothetical protein